MILVAAIPVYDEQSGDAFGLVVIEADLISRIKSILSGLDDRLGEIHVTDSEGRVLVTSNPEFGIEEAAPDVNISELVTETVGFFSSDSRQRYLSDGSSIIVHRVQLDPTDASCSLGIVQRLLSVP